MRHLFSHLLASSAYAPMTLCSIEGEGEEGAAGGGGATVSQDGGTQRVQIENTGEADAAATARAAAGGASTTEGEEKTPEQKAAEAKATEEKTPEAKPQEDKPKVEDLPDDPRLQPYTAELTEKGALSEESIAKAATEFLGEDTPLNRAMVQTYVDALKSQGEAVSAAAVQPFHEAAGGAKAYSEFQAWTGVEGNVPAGTQKAVNALLDAGKTEEALAVLQPVMEAWKADGGGKPARDLTNEAGKGDDAGAGASDAFDNWEQVTQAMNDRRYSTDSAYRSAVEAKLGRSNLSS